MHMNAKTRIVPEQDGFSYLLQRCCTVRNSAQPVSEFECCWCTVAVIKNPKISDTEIDALIGWHNRLLLDREMIADDAELCV